ncbi:MAG: M15 family metallopeptidase [Firmicutes bacterium]|nr:M15 family metallopeptidase [Bacillota bacterium]
MEEEKKKSKAKIIIPIVLAVIVIAGGAAWYLTRTETKLARTGYTKEQIADIKQLFSEEEQKALTEVPAQSGILEIAKSDRYQKEHFADYLKDLGEGGNVTDLLHNYDPWVITLRATDGYTEENLDLYLNNRQDGSAEDAAYTVNYVNMSLLYSRSSEYNEQHFEEYEKYRAKVPEKTPEEIVSHVEHAQDYANEKYFIDAYFDRYEAYRAKNPDKTLAQVVQAVNTNIDRPYYTGVVTTDMSKGYQIMVNKYYKLPDDYSTKLESLSGYGNGYLEPTAAAAFKKMVEAGREAGVNLRSLSPYRSHSLQVWQYQVWVDAHGQEMADRESARPGHSEHETGYTVDINTAVEEAHFERTAEYKWLMENCWKYGFILRYPENMEYITGYVFEPWHYRYVGPEHAEKIMKSGLTFEEYYAYYINNPDYPETGGPKE